MYTILIVEDEKIERDSLQALVSNFSLPFSNVITAENGEQGLQKYHKFHPNIILADINMPIVGGLEMIKKIRQKDRDVICLILTSYDYFSYAQEAIRLGVEDFILKPADKQTLNDSLTKVVEKLAKDKNTFTQMSSLVKKMKDVKNVLQSECFYSILTKQNEVRMQETFQMANIFATSCLCLVFQNIENKAKMDTIIRELEDICYSVIHGVVSNQLVIYVISNHKMSQSELSNILNLLERFSIKKESYSIGSVQDEMTQFYQSYEDAKHSLNSNVELSMASLSKQNNNEYLVMAKKWSDQFLNTTEGETQEMIHDLCQEFLQYDYEEVNQILSLMIENLIESIDNEYQIKIEKSELQIKKLAYINYQNLEIIVTQLLDQIFKPLKNIKYQNNSHLIKKSLIFINENYQKPISLNSLAEHLSVSPFYVSKLFTKELNRNFTDVVNDLRIKEAKKLIRKDYSFKEVAYKVGFASQSYFTKVFKKNVGMPPNEYRNLFL